MNIHYRWRHLRSTYGTRLDFLPTDLYPRQHGGGNRGAYKIFWGGAKKKMVFAKHEPLSVRFCTQGWGGAQNCQGGGPASAPEEK